MGVPGAGRSGWLVASYYLGTGPAALGVVAEAQGILADAGMWLRVGGLELNVGWVCWKLGAYHRALDHYNRVRRTFESLSESAIVQSAWAKAKQRHHPDEPRRVRRRDPAARGGARHPVLLDDTLRIVQQDRNIAHAYAEQGQYTRGNRVSWLPSPSGLNS